MQIEEAMQELKMNIESTVGRFSGNKALLERFIRKFTQDPTFHSLETAVKEEDWKAVETYAHTLKGVAGNLGFDRIFTTSADVVADVRSSDYEKAANDFELVKKEYDEVIGVISLLD